ncbi:cobyrinate a,c-diamide synthase [Saccharomonospora xinjiangensis]|uniref:cobyrinate a,c-diamide synthase n=1 Tax=Saccharomonospora xinjiangensis TaxID=75294 RepID=UPI00106FD4BB|nr:cobyrinate a,c-diamide synthase [Saccharomonospora xinjiangensis]QBQ59302.1 Cobyrinic acid A,C-diamide synthase [Saccharomonospora xinjiangensis]
MVMRIPRVVVAAPATGHGKTSVATGLMAALRARGLVVSGHKIGPDFIDPGYHALATGLPPRNLDPILQGEHRVAPLLAHGARSADMAVIEGVMGLFDGAPGTRGAASTAHVATLVSAPVLLVVDAWTASRSIAATTLGFARYDPAVRIAGVILNRVSSRGHEEEIREALDRTGVPVLGVLPYDESLRAPDRHLGLVPAGERGADGPALVSSLAAWVESGVDLDAVVRVARSAPPLPAEPWEPEPPRREHAGTDWRASKRAGKRAGRQAGRHCVAAASGAAFTFRYTETVELLAAEGIDVVDFDPLRDETLPEGCSGLYLGGGFPEAHATELSANTPLRDAIADAVARGMPVVAECAGLLYLCRDLDGMPMTGVLDAAGRMSGGGALGYREATSPRDSLLAARGLSVSGHEFHRTVVEPRHGPNPAWEWDGRAEGFASASLHASYLHVHWAGHPAVARRFASAVHGWAARDPE